MVNCKNLIGKNLLSVLVAGYSIILAPGLSAANILEEVVVTTQKRAESLQDVPIAVAAFSGEDLTNYGAAGTQALEAITPGLVFSNTGVLSSPYLRGVGSRIVFNGLEPTIAIYVDDRYSSRTTAAMFDFADVERVEVLKGPQGILYGRNVTGGAIRIITKDVSDELEGSLTAGVGNFDYWGLSGTVSVPFTDTFGARFTALTKKRDGFVKNLSPLGPKDLDDLDYQALRSKFRWEMTDNTTARLTLDYTYKSDLAGKDQVDLSPPAFSRGISRGGIAGTKKNEVATEIEKDDRRETFSLQFRVDSEFDRFDFASITTYFNMEHNFTIDADGTSNPTADVVGSDEQASEISQEFQLLSNNDSNWSWIVGANYYVSDVDFENVLLLSPTFVLGRPRQNVETTAMAVFGQTTWNFNDNWAITLGGRYSYEKKEAKGGPSTLMPPAGATLPTYSFEKSWNEFTPKATLEYRWGDNRMVYLTYARGFKSGGYDYAATSTPSALDSEILDMYELGFKADLLDDKLRFNSSLFYYDYQDLQVSRAPPGIGVGLRTENAADARVLGLDVDIIWLAGENLTITAGLNLLDTEYKDWVTAAKVFNAIITGDPTATGMGNVRFDADGASMLRAPDWSAFVSAEYNFQLGTGARVPVVLTYSYKDDYDYDFIVDPLSAGLRQDAYGLLNVRVSYVSASEKWSLALWGNNLADEDYFNDKVGAGSGFRVSYAPPRTYGVDLSYNF